MSLLQIDFNKGFVTNGESSTSLWLADINKEPEEESPIILIQSSKEKCLESIAEEAEENSSIILVDSPYPKCKEDSEEKEIDEDRIITVHTPCSSLQCLAGDDGYLLEANHLGEFETEYEKSLARNNLNIAAKTIPYTNALYPQFKTIEDALNSILYTAPIISNLTVSPSIAEKGNAITSLNISWDINVNINRLDLRIGNRTKSINPTSTSYVEPMISLTSNTVVSLTGYDDKSQTSASTTINFVEGVYYGAFSHTPPTNSQIIDSFNRILTTRNNGQFTVNAGNGEYIYALIPYESKFSVGGFEGGFELVNNNFQFSRYIGTTLRYYLYRSDNPNLGKTTVVWQLN